MRGVPLSPTEKKSIRILRGKGHTLNEICFKTGIPKATVFLYISGVTLSRKAQERIDSRRGTKFAAEKEWKEAATWARRKFPRMIERDLLIALASIYWGEGTKRDLNLINTDAQLIRLFIAGLNAIGIRNEDLRISIRIYEDINQTKALRFWSKITGVPVRNFRKTEVLRGKKSGKLSYGLCRVRVAHGRHYFKRIISLIERIKFLAHLSS